MRKTYGAWLGMEKRRIINLRSDALVNPSRRKKSSSRRHLCGQTSGILRVSASSIMSRVPILWVNTKTFSFLERASLMISRRTHNFPLNSSKLSLAVCLSMTPCHQSASSWGMSTAGSSASLESQQNSKWSFSYSTVSSIFSAALEAADFCNVILRCVSKLIQNANLFTLGLLWKDRLYETTSEGDSISLQERAKQ